MNWKRLFRILILSLLGWLTLTIFGPCTADSVRNSYHLYKMESGLRDMPVPARTQQLDFRSAVGLLVGNGNHCDFFVGAIFQSELSVQEITAHYTGRKFTNPKTGTQEEVSLAILQSTDDLERMYLPDYLDNARAWGLKTAHFAQGTVYMISIFRSCEPNHDLRCH